MYKRKIKYQDFDNVEQEKDFRFNINERELVFLEVEFPKGLEAHVKSFDPQKDAKKIVEFFERLIVMSYGERTADSQGFTKNPELLAAFVNSAAYNVLFIELLTDSAVAADFFNSIVPQPN